MGYLLYPQPEGLNCFTDKGYAAFTYSYKEKDVLIRYIKNQQEHHQKENTQNELKRLWIENGMKPDVRYFT